VKYYIIDGEASGDLHGSNLIKAILQEDPEAEIRCWGGDRMQEAGATLAKHYKEMSFMGFIEVLMHLPDIFKNLRFCKEDITAFHPDALIFIDFSGFNLRIAQWAKINDYQTHYYISPQVWASRAGRVRKIQRDIDHMYVILPFEAAFYKRYGMEVAYVGHPLIDAMEGLMPVDEVRFRSEHSLDAEKPIIALLPGSRKQEINRILKEMLSVVPDFPQYQFVIAGAPSLEFSQYEPYLQNSEVKLITGKTYSLLQHARAALVTSGTATLETALLQIPQVVCYKAGSISYHIARMIIKLKYISLVNLIMERQVVPELIQHELNKENIGEALSSILEGPARESQLQSYEILREKLGGSGASHKAAALIVKFSSPK
jgi:lipid-A-disaccharide synthase